MSLKKQESIKLLKEDLSKILIKNHIIDRYSRGPLDRGGAENYLRGCGWSHSVKSEEILEDPCITLQPPHIGDDAFHVIARHPRNRGHAAKPPVVRGHSKLHRTLKRDVGVVAGFVHTMYQWWSLLGSPR